MIAIPDRNTTPATAVGETGTRDAGLWYASHGLPVFPLHGIVDGRCTCRDPGGPKCKPGKHPRTPHGFKDATTDLAQISEWWKRWPDANIGIPTGKASGLVVLDVDPRHGGEEALDEIRNKYGGWPDTAEQITGSGGRHIVFGYADDIRNSDSLVGPGLDVRGEGGYIVAAPSMHASGNRYQWDGTEDSKTLLKIASAEWLLRVLADREPISKGNGRSRPVPITEVVKDGTKHRTIVRLACSYRRFGLPMENAFEGCRGLNFENPVSDADIWQRVRNVYHLHEPSTEATPPEHPPAAQPDDEREWERIESLGGEERPLNNGNRPYLAEPRPTPAWPDPLAAEAFHGVAGEIVHAMEPHSESDPAALLIQLLVAVGNIIGRTVHFVAEADEHYCNLYAALVGQTAKGRKGTSWGMVSRLLSTVAPDWFGSRVTSGLSSGEGLIWAVRDPITEHQPIRDKCRVIDYQTVVTDPGLTDKRLLIVESEFAKVLQVCERETNTASAVIRQGWDTGLLNTLTKNKSTRATGAHISIVGHVTKDELLRYLTSTQAGNGFANRFLWTCVARSKVLPEGGSLHTVNVAPFTRKLAEVIQYAHDAGAMRRDGQAREIWKAVYLSLSEGQPGMFGAVTGRAEAQTMRLATLHAVLDCSSTIRAEHLAAALAVWRSCEASARFIFGEALGDATADEILTALRANSGGLTRTEIRDLFGRHRKADDTGRALNMLRSLGRARKEDEKSGGRPAERWYAL